jgi:hypothetical protein
VSTTDLCDTPTTKRRRQIDYNYCSTTGEEWETTGDNYCILVACLLSFPTCDCCLLQCAPPLPVNAPDCRSLLQQLRRFVWQCQFARATVTRWVLTQPETARAAPRHGNCTAINAQQPRFPPPTALWLGWPVTAGGAARPACLPF